MLRVRTPDGGARDVDLGPSSGMHTRGPVSGTIAVPASKKGRERYIHPDDNWNPKRATDQQRRRLARQIPKARACARVMTSGTPCARTLGHADHCKSRYALDNEAARRRQRAHSDVG